MYSINPNDLTLDKLVNWLGISKDKYIVPTQEEIEILRKEYKQKLKSSSISMDIVFENAVTTWVELMSNFGIIKEGDIINPKKSSIS